MDIYEIFDMRLELTPIIEEPMPELEDDDKNVVQAAIPSFVIAPVVQELGEGNITPQDVMRIRVLPPRRFDPHGHGTFVGYMGSLAGTTEDVISVPTSASKP